MEEIKLWRTAEELIETEAVKIKGEIPEWLVGTYLRVGPAKFDFENNYSMNSWLDGYGLISKFQINGPTGTVMFNSKFIESSSYKRAIKAQRPVVSEFRTKGTGVDPSKGFFSKIISQIIPEMSDNTNHAFFNLGSELYATNDSCFYNEIDLESLKLKEKIDSNKFGLTLMSPHPLTDPQTAITYNIGVSAVLSGLKYNFIKIPKDGNFKKSKILTTISSQWSTHLSYIHSFGECPRDWLEWKPEFLNRFYIIDKETGNILNKNTEIISEHPFAVFHFINCFERDNELFIDLCYFDDPSVILYGHTLNDIRKCRHEYEAEMEKNNKREPSLKRFVIPLDSLSQKRTLKISSQGIINDKGLDLATINPRYLGRENKYYYASGLTTAGQFKSSFCKINTLDNSLLSFKESEHFVFGEPLFVPKSSFSDDRNFIGEEDDGVLIVPMTDKRVDAQDMIFFINPKNMSEIGRAVFKNHLPCALHSIFLPTPVNSIK